MKPWHTICCNNGEINNINHNNYNTRNKSKPIKLHPKLNLYDLTLHYSVREVFNKYQMIS